MANLPRPTSPPNPTTSNMPGIETPPPPPRLLLLLLLTGRLPSPSSTSTSIALIPVEVASAPALRRTNEWDERDADPSLESARALGMRGS